MPAAIMTLKQASENVRPSVPVNRSALSPHQKKRRANRIDRRLSKELENSNGETQEVLALLVPSKQRSYRISLSKQAISQTSGCARLDQVSAASKNGRKATGNQGNVHKNGHSTAVGVHYQTSQFATSDKIQISK